MLKVVFCLPGKIFSNRFLQSWTKLMGKFSEYEIEPTYSWTTGANIFAVRNSALAGDKHKGEKQLPFQGEIKYDYIMWIDSDQVFEPEQFKKLLDRLEENRNIHSISGLYLNEEGQEYGATIINQDPKFPDLKANGHLSHGDVKDKKEAIRVDFNGMGFMLVRRGVFEAISYPWFIQLRYEDPTVIEYTSEDAGFCLRASEAGFATYVDPTVIVGHEKSIVLGAPLT
jgi:glycosyl transferase family 2